jgi:hypothetical protein
MLGDPVSLVNAFCDLGKRLEKASLKVNQRKCVLLPPPVPRDGPIFERVQIKNMDLEAATIVLGAPVGAIAA